MTSDTYNILCIVFLIIGILLAVLAAALFFVFDIRKIVSVKTGMAMRKSVKELNEINRKEDNRNRKRYKGRAVESYTLDATKELNQPKSGTTVLENTEKEKDTVTPVTAILEHTGTESVEEGAKTVDETKEALGLFHITETKMVIFSSEIIGEFSKT